MSVILLNVLGVYILGIFATLIFSVASTGGYPEEIPGLAFVLFFWPVAMLRGLWRSFQAWMKS